MMHEPINLGKKQDPKFVNLGTSCTLLERQEFFCLFKQYQYVFACTYDDLKTYDTQIIQHVIPIKEGVKPFQQKLRKVHSSLEPLIQKELNNLLDARIIYKVRDSMWVSNFVHVRATFQHAMDIAFCRLIRQSVVVYLDDVTVFSRKWSNHIHHLKKIFEHCQKYGISLNPKKSIFIVSEGNLLRHIIARSGIKVDPDRVWTIIEIPHPSNKKSMESFLGKMKFLQKFISNYAQIMKPMQNIIKKNAIYSWGKKENNAFTRIKQAIADDSAL
eukprot:PITA_21619